MHLTGYPLPPVPISLSQYVCSYSLLVMAELQAFSPLLKDNTTFMHDCVLSYATISFPAKENSKLCRELFN